MGKRDKRRRRERRRERNEEATLRARETQRTAPSIRTEDRTMTFRSRGVELDLTLDPMTVDGAPTTLQGAYARLFERAMAKRPADA